MVLTHAIAGKNKTAVFHVESEKDVKKLKRSLSLLVVIRPHASSGFLHPFDMCIMDRLNISFAYVAFCKGNDKDTGDLFQLTQKGKIAVSSCRIPILRQLEDLESS